MAQKVKKTIVIKESQFQNLIQRKKDKEAIKLIESEIDKISKTLTESITLNEGIVDQIKFALKKGILTVAVISSLLASQKVNAQQLEQAGVPKAKIEQAMSTAKTDKEVVPHQTGHGLNGFIVRAYNDKDGTILNHFKQGEVNMNFMINKGVDNNGTRTEIPYKVKLVSGIDNIAIEGDSVVSYKEDANALNYRNLSPGESIESNTTSDFRTIADYQYAATNVIPTFIVSNYPAKDAQGNVIKGVYIKQGNTRMEHAQSRITQFGQVVDAGKFIPLESNKPIKIMAKNFALLFVYGPQAEATQQNQAIEFKGKFTDSFEYNSTKINTQTQEYQNKVKEIADFVKAHPDSKFAITVHGNASKVSTTYEGGNEKLAKDRAISLVNSINKSMKDMGIDLKGKVVSSKATSDVTGPEYQKGSASNKTAQEYGKEQFVDLGIKLVQ